MPGPMTVTVDVTAAKAALAGLSGPMMAAKIGTALRATALFGDRTVAGVTPVKTGVTRASIKATQTGPLGWKISSPSPIIVFLEEGTRAHVIRPRGKLLRFQAGGGVVFARRVNHPGTKARRMFAQSLPKIQQQMQAELARVLAT